MAPKGVVWNCCRSPGHLHSVATCSAFPLDDLGNYFSQVANIFRTLVRSHPFHSELFQTRHQLLFGLWLDIFPQIMFHFVPHEFNRIHVRAFQGSLPPIDVVVFNKCLSKLACVLRVIILLKPVAIWKCLTDKGLQALAKVIFGEEGGLHDPTEDGESWCTPFGNSSPNMDLVRVFWFSFQLWRLPPATERQLQVALHRHCACVGENNVVKRFSIFLTLPSKL